MVPGAHLGSVPDWALRSRSGHEQQTWGGQGWDVNQRERERERERDRERERALGNNVHNGDPVSIRKIHFSK